MSASGAPVEAEAPITPQPPAATDGAPTLVPQVRQGAEAWAVVSPDGKLALAQDYDGVVVVDLGTGVIRATPPLVGLMNLVFSGDSRYIVYVALGPKGEELHLYDLARDELKDLGVTHKKARLEVSNGGAKVLVYSDDGQTELIDAAGLVVHDRTALRGGGGWGGRVAPDGEAVIFATRSFDSIARDGHRSRFTLDRDEVAVDADLAHGRVANLFADGTVRLFDLRASSAIAEKKICDSPPGDVAFSEDGTHVLVVCKPDKGNPSIAYEMGMDLASPLEITRADSPLKVAAAGSHFFVGARGFTAFDVATGKADSPAFDTGEAGFYPVAGGALVALDGHSYVVDVAAKVRRWGPTANGTNYVEQFTATALCVGGSGLDLRTGQTFDAIGLSADGKTSFSIGEGGFVVRDRDAGTSWTTPPMRGRLETHLSPTGRWLIETGKDEKGQPTTLFQGKSEQKSVSSALWGLSQASDTVAFRVAKDAFKVEDLASGTSKKLSASTDTSLTFIGKGALALLDGKDVWDTERGVLVRSLDPSDAVKSFDPTSEWLVVGTSRDRSIRFVSARDGKGAGNPFEGEVLFQRGTVAIVERDDDKGDGGPPVFLVTEKGESPLGRLFRRSGGVYLSEDGSVVWYTRLDGFIAARRLADGRELRFLLGAAPFTDELVFDPADAARVPLMVRTGPNVRDSRMAPLTEAPSKYRHPRLVADFFSGASVSPAP